MGHDGSKRCCNGGTGVGGGIDGNDSGGGGGGGGGGGSVGGGTSGSADTGRWTRQGPTLSLSNNGDEVQMNFEIHIKFICLMFGLGRTSNI